MKIREFFSDIKLWIGLVIFFVMVGVSFAGWIQLPKKVQKIEEKTEVTEDKVQKVATTLDKFIEVQAVKDEAQVKKDIEKEKSEAKKEELMYKWIAEVSKK